MFKWHVNQIETKSKRLYNNFILVHSSSRGTSSSSANLAKVSLKIVSLQSSTQQRLNLETYKIDLTLEQNPTTQNVEPYYNVQGKLNPK